ncbi:MAG: hypothetical protein FJ086_14455 [Deltaproteobacteria bacterium]|nr:hypothetical protein [Deltaproteobacteria bacterium]
MLLVVSESESGSVDMLATILRERGLPWFRLNTYLFSAYRVRMGVRHFEIKDPSGRSITRDTASLAHRRKPFMSKEGAEHLPFAERDWTLGHWQRMTRDVVQWCGSQGKLRLVDPDGDRQLGKVNQMRLAADLFLVPTWSVTSGLTPDTPRHVVKTLVPEMIGGERPGFLYAASLPPRTALDPRYPWFVQEARPGGRDATVVYINGKCVGFVVAQLRERTGTDWRVHIQSETPLTWQRCDLPPYLERACREFMRRVRLHYGRFDFIVDDEAWWLLECNPNGQYGWLDGDTLWLHREILAALEDPATTVL